MRLETVEKAGEDRRRGRRGGKTRTEDEVGGQVLGRSVTTGVQKFNKRQSGSLRTLILRNYFLLTFDAKRSVSMSENTS